MPTNQQLIQFFDENKFGEVNQMKSQFQLESTKYLARQEVGRLIQIATNIQRLDDVLPRIGSDDFFLETHSV